MAERTVVFLNQYGYPESVDTASDSITLNQLTINSGPVLSSSGISMGDTSVSGINNLSFTDVNGQIAGIENQNLVDKSAAESVTGTWTFSQIDMAAVDDTIAGIENQNLLDKTAIETISGAWTYSNNISFSTGTVTIAGIENQNLVDKSAAETISGLWTYSTLPQSSATPTNSTDLVTKSYADDLISGVDAKDSVRCATIAALTGTGLAYASNSITWTAGNGPIAIDGYTLQNDDRILVKDETDGAGILNAEHNGIYVRVSQDQWDRDVDADTWVELVSAFTFVEEGTTNADTGWVCTVDTGGTIGTDDITWVQFSSAGVLTPGHGLGNSGNTWYVDPSDLVSGDYGLEANGADPGATLRLSLAIDSGLHFNTGLEVYLDGTTLTKGASGLKVSTDGITNTEIDNDGSFAMTGKWDFGGGALELPASAPGTPVSGDTYFASDTLNIYNGTSWVAIGKSAGTITATGGEVAGIADGDVVYISAASTVKKTDATAFSTSGSTIGVADEAIASAASGNIITNGLKTKTGWGLTAGDLYYADPNTAGAITNTYSDITTGEWIIVVGRALSATELIVDIDVVGRK